jgi:hypothetical protein
MSSRWPSPPIADTGRPIRASTPVMIPKPTTSMTMLLSATVVPADPTLRPLGERRIDRRRLCLGTRGRLEQEGLG